LEIAMADYYEHTVVQQIIPDADMTPLERLLLSRIFETDRVDDGWFFFTDQGPCPVISVTRAELDEALASRPDKQSAAHTYVADQHANAIDNAGDIDMDLDISGTSWECFFQDIVARSKTLTYISVVTAFTCNKMRADGFGGMAILITPRAIVGKSTGDFLEDMIAEAGLEAEGPGTKTSDPAGADETPE
jgi:hypothetical protein